MLSVLSDLVSSWREEKSFAIESTKFTAKKLNARYRVIGHFAQDGMLMSKKRLYRYGRLAASHVVSGIPHPLGFQVRKQKNRLHPLF